MCCGHRLVDDVGFLWPQGLILVALSGGDFIPLKRCFPIFTFGLVARYAIPFSKFLDSFFDSRGL